MDQTYHIAKEGQTYGPYDGQTISRYLKEGRLSVNDHFLDPVSQSWRPIGNSEILASTAHHPPLPTPPRRLPKQFGYGSLAIALGAFVVMVILFSIAGVLEATEPGYFQGQSMGAAILGLIYVLLIVLQVISVAFGIVSKMSREPTAHLGTWGIVIAGVQLLIAAILMIAGPA